MTVMVMASARSNHASPYVSSLDEPDPFMQACLSASRRMIAATLADRINRQQIAFQTRLVVEHSMSVISRCGGM
jgi:hypothetical protein